MKFRLTPIAAISAALMSFTVHAGWTYDSSTQVLENEDWTISSAALKTASGKNYLKVSGPIARKAESTSTTIDLTGAAAAAKASFIELWASVGSELGVKRFIAPDVTSLREHTTFYGNTTVEEIELSPDVTTFGHNVFNGTTALKTLRPRVFPSLTSMGQGVFQESAVEGDFEFPAITQLNMANVFLKAQNITSLKFDSLTEATQNYTFCGMTSLTNFYAPNAVRMSTIAFYHSNYSAFPCAKLETVTLSANATSIPQFHYCAALKSLTPTEFPLLTSSQVTFNGCSNLTGDFSMPSVTELPQSAFKGTGITSLNVPSLAKIPELCFDSCTKLTSVTIQGSASTIPRSTISGVPDNFTLNWLGTDAPAGFTTYGETKSFMPGNSLCPLIVRAPITDGNRAAWESLCTTVAANFTDAHRAPTIRSSPNGRLVLWAPRP